jgi:hypothetical protein
MEIVSMKHDGTITEGGSRTDAIRTLAQAAKRFAAAGQEDAHPHEDDAAAEHLVLAARDLVRAVNGLEPAEQPAQWSRRVPCSIGRTASPEIAPYSEDGEDCPACSEVQDKCRYHQGYDDALADAAKKTVA